MGQLKLPLLVGMHNRTDTLENSLAVSYNVKTYTSHISSHPVSRHLDKRNENLFLQNKNYMHIYSGFNHNHLKLETTQYSSFGEWRNTMWYIHIRDCYSSTEKNGLLIHIRRTQIRYAQLRKLDSKDCTQCDFHFIILEKHRDTKQVNSCQRLKLGKGRVFCKEATQWNFFHLRHLDVVGIGTPDWIGWL